MENATVPARSRASLPFRFAALAATSGGSAGLLLVGRRVSLVAFLALCALAFGGYVVVVVRPLGRRVMLAATGALLTLAVVVGPIASSDLWAYAMYGRIVSEHGENPYRVPPEAFPDDPALERVLPQFRDGVSVYGPAFTLFSAAGTAVTGSSRVATRVFFQASSALAVFAAVFILGLRSRYGSAPAFLGLNPVVIVSVVGDGHNDALVGLAVLGGVLLVVRRPVVGGILLGLAASIKLTALLPLAAVAVWAGRRSGPRTGVAVGIAGGATTAISYLVAGGVDAVRPVLEAGRLIARHSIWHALSLPSGLARTAAAVTVVLVTLILVLRHLGDEEPTGPVGASYAPYLLGATYVLPWYGAAALPTLALGRRDLLAWIVAAHMMLLFVVYPDLRPASELQRLAATRLTPAFEATGLVLFALAARRRGRGTPGAAPSSHSQ